MLHYNTCTQVNNSVAIISCVCCVALRGELVRADFELCDRELVRSCECLCLFCCETRSSAVHRNLLHDVVSLCSIAMECTHDVASVSDIIAQFRYVVVLGLSLAFVMD